MLKDRDIDIAQPFRSMTMIVLHHLYSRFTDTKPKMQGKPL